MKHSKKTELELSRKYHEVFDLYLPGVCIHAKSLKPWLTLCNPMDHSSAHGILQARILEWVALTFSRDLPSPGIESLISMSPALTGGFFTTSATWEAHLSGMFSQEAASRGSDLQITISFRKETEISKVLLLLPDPQAIIWFFVSTLLFSWKRI